MGPPPEIPPVYFRIHLVVLFCLGIDIMPIKNRIRRLIFYLYASFMIGLMCLFTILEFMDMILNFEGIQKMTFALCYFVTHVLATVKMFLMISLRRRLWQQLVALEGGIFKPNYLRGGNVEFEVVKDAIRLCRHQGCFFYSFVIIIIGARTIYAALANWPYDKNDYFDGNVTVIVNTKVMPYTTWMPFDYNVSPYYELVFAYQIFCTVIYGYYIGATDALICGFMMLIKAQFLIVKAELDTLIERAIEESGSDPDMLSNGVNRIELLDKETQCSLSKLSTECVIHHQKLITFCDQAENDFCYLMLLQFISSLLIMCFQLFQVSTISPGSVEFFSMSMYLVLMVFQILCYCWNGNEVQRVSGQVSSYVYNINWIIMDESVKKSLLLMMMRSQRNCYFTAGKFSLLSLQTFMTVSPGGPGASAIFTLFHVLQIVRGAASYFMFLRQMNT